MIKSIAKKVQSIFIKESYAEEKERIEMENSFLEEIESILIKEHNYKIYTTIGSYLECKNSYTIFIYWETDKELELITDTVKQEIRKIILDYFSKCTYYPNKIEDVTIYFDSDENVQKNYSGNYYYATL